MKAKISLEQYLHFFNFGKQTDPTVIFLNQIIYMHGFRKANNKVSKKAITEAIKTLDLVNLSRSTLRDNGVSSCAAIGLKDIIADLNELSWQDCCTTSIQTLNFSSNHQITNSEPTADGSSTGGGASKNYCRKRKKGPGSSVSGDLRSSSSVLVSSKSA